MGRKSGAHHARREVTAYNEFAAEFEQLASGLNAFLDRGDFSALVDPLYALEDLYEGELHPLDPTAPRGQRLTEHARRFAKATFAKSFLLSLQRTIDDRISSAQAHLIATAAEPVEMPQYWQRLVGLIRAEGVRQEDIHPGSRALARHVAAAIRQFNATDVAGTDETYSDAPLDSWSQLPREFAGFRLADVSLDDARFVFPPDVFALPPSTDIAFFTMDRVAPPVRPTRRETYRAWMSVIEEWAARGHRELHHQQSAVWAMMLGHRLRDDSSDVKFFNGKVIESPWQRGGFVVVEVVEDDIPERFR